MRLRLGDEDRARFGLDEWLEFDLRNISVADMDELSERFGFDPDDWPVPFEGELTLEQAGDPDARPKPPRWRMRALCWMLLRQNGVAASWDEAGTVKYMLIRTERAAEPEPEPESPGKEATAATRSPRSAGSTTRRSATSSASRRKKST